MTPLLTYLVWAAVLTFVQMIVAVLLALPGVGLPTLAGNREGMAELPGVAGRAERAHLNMLQSLVLFAILALVAHVSQRATPNVVLGAQVFLGEFLVDWNAVLSSLSLAIRRAIEKGIGEIELDFDGDLIDHPVEMPPGKLQVRPAAGRQPRITRPAAQNPHHSGLTTPARRLPEIQSEAPLPFASAAS